MTKIKGLDTLRAFAVFFVLIEHMGVWFNEWVGWGPFVKKFVLPGGSLGVTLFFVLSGFLITSILLNAKNNQGNSKSITIIKNFFIRRSLRIFPIYYLLVIILFLAKYPDADKNIWYYLSYSVNFLCYHTNSWNNFSHTWTLDIEEQFYLLWPWLVIFISNRYFKFIAGAAILLGMASTYYVLIIAGRIAPLMVFNCMDAFGIGALYAGSRILSTRHNNMLFEKVVKIIAVVAFVIAIYWDTAFYLKMPQIMGLSMVKTVHSIISLAIIIIVVNNRSVKIEKYFLGNRFLNYIGKISYGIYLYHYVYIIAVLPKVNEGLQYLTQSSPTLNAIANNHQVNYWIHFILIILISSVSFRFVEQPFLNMKDKYFKLRKVTPA